MPEACPLLPCARPEDVPRWHDPRPPVHTLYATSRHRWKTEAPSPLSQRHRRPESKIQRLRSQQPSLDKVTHDKSATLVSRRHRQGIAQNHPPHPLLALQSLHQGSLRQSRLPLENHLLESPGCLDRTTTTSPAHLAPVPRSFHHTIAARLRETRVSRRLSRA